MFTLTRIAELHALSAFRPAQFEKFNLAESLPFSRFLRGRILLKASHRRGLIFWQITLWIYRGLPTFRRGERQIDTSISENEVRGGTFFEPKTGFAPCIAKLVV